MRADFLAGLHGDKSRYCQFLMEIAGFLRAYFHNYVCDADADIEHILQLTLSAIHRARHTYRERDHLGPWIIAIARYSALEFFRSRVGCSGLRKTFDNGNVFELQGPNVEGLAEEHNQAVHDESEFHLAIEPAKQNGFDVVGPGARKPTLRARMTRGITTLARLLRRTLRIRARQQ